MSFLLPTNNSSLEESRRMRGEMKRIIDARERAICALEALIVVRRPAFCDDLLKEVFLRCESRDIFHGSLVCTHWHAILKNPIFLRDFFVAKAPNVFHVGADLPPEGWHLYGRAQLFLAAIDARRERIEEEQASVWNLVTATIKQLTPW